MIREQEESGIGIRVCIDRMVYPNVGRLQEEARQRAPGGRRLEFSEGLPLRNRSGCFWGNGEPARLWESGGLWTGRISRVRILASALGPALDRQAGFTAARPTAKSELQRQAVLTVVPEDRSLLTRVADGELSCASRTLRLSHDVLAQLIESR